MADTGSSWEGWSGAFWTSGRSGFMSVHWDDRRLHKPPQGWCLAEIHHDEEAETYIYERLDSNPGQSIPVVSVTQPDQLAAQVQLAVQADEA